MLVSHHHRPHGHLGPRSPLCLALRCHSSTHVPVSGDRPPHCHAHWHATLAWFASCKPGTRSCGAGSIQEILDTLPGSLGAPPFPPPCCRTAWCHADSPITKCHTSLSHCPLPPPRPCFPFHKRAATSGQKVEQRKETGWLFWLFKKPRLGDFPCAAAPSAEKGARLHFFTAVGGEGEGRYYRDRTAPEGQGRAAQQVVRPRVLWRRLSQHFGVQVCIVLLLRGNGLPSCPVTHDLICFSAPDIFARPCGARKRFLQDKRSKQHVRSKCITPAQPHLKAPVTNPQPAFQ